MSIFYTHRNIFIGASLALLYGCSHPVTVVRPEPLRDQALMIYMDGHVLVSAASTAAAEHSRLYAGRLRRIPQVGPGEWLNNVAIRVDESTRRNLEMQLAAKEKEQKK